MARMDRRNRRSIAKSKLDRLTLYLHYAMGYYGFVTGCSKASVQTFNMWRFNGMLKTGVTGCNQHDWWFEGQTT
jgi:hypothetical protein